MGSVDDAFKGETKWKKTNDDTAVEKQDTFKKTVIFVIGESTQKTFLGKKLYLVRFFLYHIVAYRLKKWLIWSF